MGDTASNHNPDGRDSVDRDSEKKSKGSSAPIDVLQEDWLYEKLKTGALLPTDQYHGQIVSAVCDHYRIWIGSGRMEQLTGLPVDVFSVHINAVCNELLEEISFAPSQGEAHLGYMPVKTRLACLPEGRTYDANVIANMPQTMFFDFWKSEKARADKERERSPAINILQQPWLIQQALSFSEDIARKNIDYFSHLVSAIATHYNLHILDDLRVGYLAGLSPVDFFRELTNILNRCVDHGDFEVDLTEPSLVHPGTVSERVRSLGFGSQDIHNRVSKMSRPEFLRFWMCCRQFRGVYGDEEVARRMDQFWAEQGFAPVDSKEPVDVFKGLFLPGYKYSRLWRTTALARISKERNITFPEVFGHFAQRLSGHGFMHIVNEVVNKGLGPIEGRLRYYFVMKARGDEMSPAYRDDLLVDVDSNFMSRISASSNYSKDMEGLHDVGTDSLWRMLGLEIFDISPGDQDFSAWMAMPGGEFSRRLDHAHRELKLGRQIEGIAMSPLLSGSSTLNIPLPELSVWERASDEQLKLYLQESLGTTSVRAAILKSHHTEPSELDMARWMEFPHSEFVRRATFSGRHLAFVQKKNPAAKISKGLWALEMDLSELASFEALDEEGFSAQMTDSIAAANAWLSSERELWLGQDSDLHAKQNDVTTKILPEVTEATLSQWLEQLDALRQSIEGALSKTQGDEQD